MVKAKVIGRYASVEAKTEIGGNPTNINIEKLPLEVEDGADEYLPGPVDALAESMAEALKTDVTVTITTTYIVKARSA